MNNVLRRLSNAQKMCVITGSYVFLNFGVTSCTSDFSAGPSVNLDGYGNYPTEVAPVTDLGTPDVAEVKEPEYTGLLLQSEECRKYSVDASDATGLKRELTALFSGSLSFHAGEILMPVKNTAFTLTTHLQFFEKCEAKEGGCGGTSKSTKDDCCPDGYLSLDHVWEGMTGNKSDFSLTLALSPLDDWKLISSPAGSGKSKADLYYMHTGKLTLMKFEYSVQFKSDSFSKAQCGQICQIIDFEGSGLETGDCEKLCSSGSFLFQSETIDLLGNKTHCPEKTELFRFGKIENQSPLFYSIKNTSTGKKIEIKTDPAVDPASTPTPSGK